MIDLITLCGATVPAGDGKRFLNISEPFERSIKNKNKIKNEKKKMEAFLISPLPSRDLGPLQSSGAV